MHKGNVSSCTLLHFDVPQKSLAYATALAATSELIRPTEAVVELQKRGKRNTSNSAVSRVRAITGADLLSLMILFSDVWKAV